MGQPLKSSLPPRPVVAVDLKHVTPHMNGDSSTGAGAAGGVINGVHIVCRKFLLPGQVVDRYRTASYWVFLHYRHSSTAGKMDARS
jgi:hypothetical protein